MARCSKVQANIVKSRSSNLAIKLRQLQPKIDVRDVTPEFRNDMQWQQQCQNMSNRTNCGLSMINIFQKIYTHMDTYTHTWTHLYTYGHIHRAKLISVTPVLETWYGNQKKIVDDSCDSGNRGTPIPMKWDVTIFLYGRSLETLAKSYNPTPQTFRAKRKTQN